MQDYVELNAFIKVHGLANTGGKARHLIRSGAIKVNGQEEMRNKRKLRLGDVVEFSGRKFVVKEENIKR